MSNWKLYYWFFILILLLVPITNSFITNSKKMVKSYLINNEQKQFLTKLNAENKRLGRTIKYYRSSEGQKSLIKDRLNKVEEGESIIEIK